jgi:hypothetical protein
MIVGVFNIIGDLLGDFGRASCFINEDGVKFDPHNTGIGATESGDVRLIRDWRSDTTKSRALFDLLEQIV